MEVSEKFRDQIIRAMDDHFRFYNVEPPQDGAPQL